MTLSEIFIIFVKQCQSVGMVYKTDLKSVGQMLVWVRVPPLIQWTRGVHQSFIQDSFNNG